MTSPFQPINDQSASITSATPLCPVFGKCGGCAHQNLSYADELILKEQQLRHNFITALNISADLFDPIVPSPKEYNYRHRLDLAMRRLKAGEMLFGFSSAITRQIVPVDHCPIAMEAVSNYLPKLKQEALARWPADYNRANLTIKTGDDGQIFWGGIGKKSLMMSEQDYLWTLVEGKKIFYSLDTFFQANLSILPEVARVMRELGAWNKQTTFFDLYGGAGLFSVLFAGEVNQVYLIEESTTSTRVAEFNKKFHQFSHLHIISQKVEQALPHLLSTLEQTPSIALIDPPRHGLSDTVRDFLKNETRLKRLLYLSCGPESLIRDLKELIAGGWNLNRIIPFDFFPKTPHVEVLTLLTR